ncbi:MAG: leucine-rich repeat domain-containing protein, partial [Terrimicrobiaceae bacterium]
MESSITITGCVTQPVGVLDIPATINGKPVTSIGDLTFSGRSGLTNVTIPSSVTSIGGRAFSNCSDLKSITIPLSVASIGASAFQHCRGLTSITIPSSVTSIGGAAFEDCSGLTSITIPSSVKTIETGAFGGCSGLTSVSVDASNSNYSSVDGVLFDKLKATLLQYPAGKAGVYEIPPSVTRIGSVAFDNCRGL